MRRALTLAGYLGLAGLVAGPAAAGDAPVVVELFTSQACYSCPPAEAFLAQLAERDGVLALEFHVDYWNSLVYGLAGRWQDPFSKAEYTQRQRAYNIAIRDTGQVYTPQTVVDGRDEAVGSREGAIEQLIRRNAADTRSRVGVAVARTGPDTLRVSLDGSGRVAEMAGTDVWLVRFLRRKTTEVRAGENKGKTLTSAHIVTGMRRIGAWPGSPATLAVDGATFSDQEDCAVLVQSAEAGPILGAARCPAPQS